MINSENTKERYEKDKKVSHNDMYWSYEALTVQDRESKQPGQEWTESNKRIGQGQGKK